MSSHCGTVAFDDQRPLYAGSRETREMVEKSLQEGALFPFVLIEACNT